MALSISLALSSAGHADPVSEECKNLNFTSGELKEIIKAGHPAMVKEAQTSQPGLESFVKDVYITHSGSNDELSLLSSTNNGLTCVYGVRGKDEDVLRIDR